MTRNKKFLQKFSPEQRREESRSSQVHCTTLQPCSEQALFNRLHHLQNQVSTTTAHLNKCNSTSSGNTTFIIQPVAVPKTPPQTRATEAHNHNESFSPPSLVTPTPVKPRRSTRIRKPPEWLSSGDCHEMLSPHHTTYVC